MLGALLPRPVKNLVGVRGFGGPVARKGATIRTKLPFRKIG
jgi:hypothetical protein